MKMKLDDLDLRLIWHLDYDARLAATELSKTLGVSKQSVAYRLKKLEQEGVVKGYLTQVDIHQLGYLSFRIYFKLKNIFYDRSAAFERFLTDNPYTLWVVRMNGAWDLQVVFTVRDYIHLNRIFKKIMQRFGAQIHKYNISMTAVSYSFKRDYLVKSKRDKRVRTYFGFEPRPHVFDVTDYKLIGFLAQNARATMDEVVKGVGISFPTVKARLKKLEAEKVIQGYRLLSDSNRLGRRYYKALLSLYNISEELEAKIYDYCASQDFVTYLNEVLGDWQLEVEVEVLDISELHDLLKKLRQKFSSHIVDYEILEITEELKHNYFPMAEELINQPN